MKGRLATVICISVAALMVGSIPINGYYRLFQLLVFSSRIIMICFTKNTAVHSGTKSQASESRADGSMQEAVRESVRLSHHQYRER